MKTNAYLFHLCIVVALVLQAEPHRKAPKFKEGWQERRGNLLWWYPDNAFAEANAAFERQHGLEPGGAVKHFYGMLEAELAKPDGGDSNTVTQALERLSRSGTLNVTNVLEKALLLKKNDHRFQTLLACINVWPADMSGLAQSVVQGTPPEMRSDWYASLIKRNQDSWQKGQVARDFMRIGEFMNAAAQCESEARCAMALDRAQLTLGLGWEKSGQRKSLALRFKDAEGNADEYFSKLAMEKVVASTPTASDISLFVRFGPEWPDDLSSAGEPPYDYVEGWYQNAYRSVSLRFGVTKHEFIRMIADQFEAFLQENSQSHESETLWYGYVTALKYGADPAATNALLRAFDAGWIPGSGARLIDSALLACAPDWKFSEARKQMVAKMAERSPDQFSDVPFFRDLQQKLGQKNATEEKK